MQPWLRHVKRKLLPVEVLTGSVQCHDLRQGLDEFLPQAVGVCPLIGDQQQITRLNTLAEIAESPDIVRSAKRAKDEALVLRP